MRRLKALYRLGRWAVRRATPRAAAQRTALTARLEAEARRLGLRYATEDAHPCHSLVHRLLRQQVEFFAFVHVDGVAPDNNLAARSPEGTTTRLTLASLCRTWLARDQNPFVACLALLRQQPSLTTP